MAFSTVCILAEMTAPSLLMSDSTSSIVRLRSAAKTYPSCVGQVFDVANNQIQTCLNHTSFSAPRGIDRDIAIADDHRAVV
jgi:hypothetical protein